MKQILGEGRVRRSEQEREEVLKEYRKGGRTQKQFCRDVGIAVPTLYAWLKREQSRNVEHMRLIEVPMVEPEMSHGEVVIEIGKGARVRVPVGAKVEWVAQLLRAL